MKATPRPSALGPVAIGIDVGTTYTAAALADADHAAPVSLAVEALAVPTTVFVGDDSTVFVGIDAERRSESDPSRTARGFKARVGDDTPMIIGGAPWPPQLLMTQVHRWAIRAAVAADCPHPDVVVLTHPASWREFRLEVLQQAAQQAELGNVFLLSEPEAAATFHASKFDLPPGRAVAVYDFGGGTF